jgi:hypothetical protein
MGKIANHRVYVIVVAVCLCLASVFFVRSCFSARNIYASVSPLDVKEGVPVLYADSTKGADNWFWEFGNGDTSSLQRGEYIYERAGKYQIRLTVDGKLEKKFIINVRPPKKDDMLNQSIRIIAPPTGMQGEYIVFRGDGSSTEWRWEFGETGVIDAREKTVIYKYLEPGTYDVKLMTEETKYPVVHKIVIEPQYMDNDTLDVESVIGNDIKERLQAIIDQKPFNPNYNYVLSNYLCNNPNTLVIVNNTKKNDFYSYCQGLKLIGRKKTVIENVVIEMGTGAESCVQKLIVIQTDN